MTLDLRSLAALRIVLAFTVLVDLADRELYTDVGPVKLADLGAALTFHRGPAALIVALFVVHALVAIALGCSGRAHARRGDRAAAELALRGAVALEPESARAP